jgi:hypothetical protein
MRIETWDSRRPLDPGFERDRLASLPAARWSTA